MDGFNHDIVPVEDADTAASKRKRSRDSLFLTARLRLEGEDGEREVRIRNLSSGGMMAELGRAVPIGTGATLDVRGIGEVSGRIAWCAEGRVGIALDAAIDPKLARKPVGGRPTPLFTRAAPRR